MLKQGSKAPEFSLKDRNSNLVNLKEISSKFIIVYFYPKDNTPGCTIEAKEFSNLTDEFKKLGVKIIGISGGDEKSKKSFCNKYDLKVILLSDPDFSVSKKYKVYGKKSFMGKEFFGIKRTTFILDKSKKIIKIYQNVSPSGHAQEVLNFLADK